MKLPYDTSMHCPFAHSHAHGFRTLLTVPIFTLFLRYHLQLCFDLIQEWIKNNPTASICTSDGVGKFKDIAIFQDYHGLPEFRQVSVDSQRVNMASLI